MRPLAIELCDLQKNYGDVRALRGVSLQVPQHHAVGLVGPNGAGKSSLFRIICGLGRPDAGTAAIFGSDPIRDPVGAKARLGCVPEHSPLFDLLTGEEQLYWTGRLNGVPDTVLAGRISELTRALDLNDALPRRIGGYSKGMRQKLAFVAALIHDPRVIVMDEPFEGVDVLAVEVMKTVLRQFVEIGAAVLLSSHILQLVEDVCDHFALINEGQIVFEGNRQALAYEADRLEAVPSGRSLESVFLGLIAPERRVSRLQTVAIGDIL